MYISKMQRREVVKDCWLRVIRNLSGIQQSSINICSATKAMQHHNLGNLPSNRPHYSGRGVELFEARTFLSSWISSRPTPHVSSDKAVHVTYIFGRVSQKERGRGEGGELKKFLVPKNVTLFCIIHSSSISLYLALLSCSRERPHGGPRQ